MPRGCWPGAVRASRRPRLCPSGARPCPPPPTLAPSHPPLSARSRRWSSKSSRPTTAPLHQSSRCGARNASNHGAKRRPHPTCALPMSLADLPTACCPFDPRPGLRGAPFVQRGAAEAHAAQLEDGGPLVQPVQHDIARGALSARACTARAGRGRIAVKRASRHALRQGPALQSLARRRDVCRPAPALLHCARLA